MILELSTLCLQSICDAVETGQIRGHHIAAKLPPTMPAPTSYRQSLLDMSLIRGSIDNPNCIAAFGSIEFLDGMTSLRTTINEDGRVWPSAQFYELWLASLASVSPLDPNKTIGSRIEQLQLCVLETGLELISNIVSSCSNLHTFELIATRDYKTNRNVINSARSLGQNPVVSQLHTLTIDYRSYNSTFFESFLSNVRFTNLRSLHLSGCAIDRRQWEKFLREVNSTLESLDIMGKLIILRGSVHEEAKLIPFPMDRLHHLRIGFYFSDYEFRLSTDILAQCSSLTHLEVRDWAQGDDFARALMQLPNFNLNVDVFLIDGPHGNLLVDGGAPRFRIVDLYKDKITGFTLNVGSWEDIYIEAFKDFIAACPNMIRLRFRTRNTDPPLDLGPLFDNPYQCGRFKEIVLWSNAKFGNLFVNCIELDHLNLDRNPNVRDQDLIAWTELGGGRLSRLTLTYCPNVTHVGVIALLIASGSKLARFYFKCNVLRSFAFAFEACEEMEAAVKRAVSKYCPNAITPYVQ